MRGTVLALALAIGCAAPVAAQTMPLPVFVERATRLQNKGPLAIFARGEIKALQAEMQGANKAVIADYQANKKNDAKQAFCPVKGEKYQLGPMELMNQLRAIPAAQARSMTTKDAMRHLIAKRFPC